MKNTYTEFTVKDPQTTANKPNICILPRNYFTMNLMKNMFGKRNQRIFRLWYCFVRYVCEWIMMMMTRSNCLFVSWNSDAILDLRKLCCGIKFGTILTLRSLVCHKQLFALWVLMEWCLFHFLIVLYARFFSLYSISGHSGNLLMFFQWHIFIHRNGNKRINK